MKVTHNTDDSKEYSVPLDVLFDENEFISLKTETGKCLIVTIKEGMTTTLIDKVDLIVKGCETIEETKFLLSLLNFIRENKKFFLVMHDTFNYQRASFILDENSDVDLDFFLENNWSHLVSPMFCTTILEYMFCSILKDLFVAEECGDDVFEYDKLDAHRLRFGEGLAETKEFETFSKVMYFIQHYVKG